MEIEDKKAEEFEMFQIEDGVYILSNTSFSQVPLTNSYLVSKLKQHLTFRKGRQ